MRYVFLVALLLPLCAWFSVANARDGFQADWLIKPYAFHDPFVSDSLSSVSTDKRGNWIILYNSYVDRNVHILHSQDDARTWSAPELYRVEDRIAIESSGVRVKCSPAGTCIGPGLGCGVGRSVDGGISWSRAGCDWIPIAGASSITYSSSQAWMRASWSINRDMPEADYNVHIGRSLDDGVSWESLDSLPLEESAPAWLDREPLIAAGAGGTWLLIWLRGEWPYGASSFSLHKMLSEDNGTTWSEPEVVFPQLASPNFNQGLHALECTPEGHCVLTFQKDYVYFSNSYDSGRTWTEPIPIDTEPGYFDLDSPSLATDGKGTWINLWTREGFFFYPLNPFLRLDDDTIMSISRDDGLTWSKFDYLTTEGLTHPSLNEADTDGRNAVLAGANGTWVSVREVGLGPAISISRDTDSGAYYEVDFTLDEGHAFGWTPAVSGDSATTATVGAAGICMTVPVEGDNGAAWVPPNKVTSPNNHIPLVELSAYEIQVGVSTDQSAPDAIPLLDVSYDNYTINPSPLLWPRNDPSLYLHGNTYGGQAVFVDLAGGGNGIGRPQGRGEFSFIAAPNSALFDAWGRQFIWENEYISTMEDLYNDFRLIFRVLDYDSAGIGSERDSGTVCVGGMKIFRHDLGSFAVDSVAFEVPVTSKYFGAETYDQAGAGFASIDDATASARFQLTADGPGSRKTLFPWNRIDPVAANIFFPIPWESGAIYKGTVWVHAESSEADPPKIIGLVFDTATHELVQAHYTNRGGPGNMDRFASPKLLATTGGRAQPYIAFFHANNRTVLDTVRFPDAGYFRFMADFINTPVVNPAAQGADPFVVSGMKVERVSLH